MINIKYSVIFVHGLPESTSSNISIKIGDDKKTLARILTHYSITLPVDLKPVLPGPHSMLNRSQNKVIFKNLDDHPTILFNCMLLKYVFPS